MNSQTYINTKLLPNTTQEALNELLEGSLNKDSFHSRRKRAKKAGKYQKYIELGLAFSIYVDITQNI